MFNPFKARNLQRFITFKYALVKISESTDIIIIVTHHTLIRSTPTITIYVEENDSGRIH